MQISKDMRENFIMVWNMERVNTIIWKDSYILVIGLRIKSKGRVCIFMKMVIDTMVSLKTIWNMVRGELMKKMVATL